MNYSKLHDNSFPKEYYEFIWGTVHNHDYADNQAEHLIQKFGNGRYLDVGCGCGALVKSLRKKGCEAYGIEVSDYAISQSDIPEFVTKGDIRKIPYPDNYFDTVVSIGSVINYCTEDELPIAIAELRRVGKNQYHVISMNGALSHGMKSIKSREWWEENFPEGII